MGSRFGRYKRNTLRAVRGRRRDSSPSASTGRVSVEVGAGPKTQSIWLARLTSIMAVSVQKNLHLGSQGADGPH
jgi:hypothetical protein